MGRAIFAYFHPMFHPPFQVSVIQYGVNPQFEFRLSDYTTQESLLAAVSKITQMYGHSTNTFAAIQYAR